MTFGRYLLVRICLAALMLLLTAAVCFVIIRAAPGDPAVILAGEFATHEVIEGIRDLYGLNESFSTQLTSYFGRLLVGDFGRSYAYNQPVLTVIASRLPATLLLLFASQTLGIILGIIFGTIAARSYGRWLDTLIVTVTSVVYALPVFWLGMLCILLFALRLGWLPAMGMSSLFGPTDGWGRVWDVALHLILPATTLALVWVVPATLRITRSSVNAVQHEQFTATARSKGLPERVVFFKHVLRNAMLPIVTIVGLNLSRAVSGSLLTETVFGWPGIGRLMYEALSRRDYPLLMGGLLLASTAVILGTLLVDLLYKFLDPRVEHA